MVYKGVYGDWRVEDSDVREVQGYRAGLTVAAAGMMLRSSYVNLAKLYVMGFLLPPRCLCALAIVLDACLTPHAERFVHVLRKLCSWTQSSRCRTASWRAAPGSLKALQDGIAVVGAAGFGASLFLIHIYVTPLKRFIQLLWGVGFLSGVALMATQVLLCLVVVSMRKGLLF